MATTTPTPEPAPLTIASPSLVAAMRELLDALSEVNDADVRAIAERARGRLLGGECRRV